MYYDKQTEVVPEASVKELEPWGKLLLDAAQYIRDHGWCQGEAVNSAGSACLMGALRVPLHWKPEYDIAMLKLRQACGTSIPFWNDSICKTESEAIAKLEEAARS